MVQGGKISRSWLRVSSRGMQNKQLVERDRATDRWGGASDRAKDKTSQVAPRHLFIALQMGKL
jgi:hypothetical protein